MLARWMRQLGAIITIGLSLSCGGDKSRQTQISATDLDKTFGRILEQEWNFELRKKIFLGPTYFGNTSTGGGRHSGSLHALALISDYSTYRALATKGLITLTELNLADTPAGVFDSGVRIERAATVTLTEAGAKAGDVDTKANTVTFALGAYRVEKITLNTAVGTSESSYRLVEGMHVLSINPEFSDIWAELGWPTYRDRRFRAIFKYDLAKSEWWVVPASNGMFAASDTGRRDGNFESENVPPTLEQLRPSGK